MDEEDELFDWASNIYKSDSLPGSGDKIDLTQYEVYVGSIEKDPATGEEKLVGFEVKRI